MPAATPYRAPTLRAPRDPAADDLAEVTVTWGDQVLAVAHLKPGEGFAWAGAGVVVWRDGRWVLTPPAGATGWARRGGEATVEALGEGCAHALDADDRAGVALGDVAVRVARTTAPEALPRARGARRFTAWTAALMVLAATGLATAQGDEDDGTIARDDTAERAWLAAHVRPYTEHAPPADVGRPILRVTWAGNGCGELCTLQRAGACVLACPRGCPGEEEDLDASARFTWRLGDELPARRLEAAYVHAVRLAAVEVSHAALADTVRRVVLRNVGQLSRCRQEARELARPGRAVVRFAVGPTGAVLASGVASSTARPNAMVDCFAAALRRWHFAETPRGEVAVATVTLTVR